MGNRGRRRRRRRRREVYRLLVKKDEVTGGFGAALRTGVDELFKVGGMRGVRGCRRPPGG